MRGCRLHTPRETSMKSFEDSLSLVVSSRTRPSVVCCVRRVSTMAAPDNSDSEFDNLDWIKYKANLERTHTAETGLSRLGSLAASNPFVPLGTIGTVTALVLGLKNFVGSDSRKQQLMMRARVGSQGFTVLALVGGAFYQAFKV